MQSAGGAEVKSPHVLSEDSFCKVGSINRRAKDRQRGESPEIEAQVTLFQHLNGEGRRGEEAYCNFLNESKDSNNFNSTNNSKNFLRQTFGNVPE